MNNKLIKILAIALILGIPFNPIIAQDCSIQNVIAEPHPCTPNGIFYVDIDFEFENVGQSGYRVQGNGNNYGNFNYDEPFITLGPFEGDGTTVWEFVITDNDHPDCSNFVVLEPISCTSHNCEIGALDIALNDCDNDGDYDLDLNFEFANVENVGFDFFINEDFFGFYSYNDLPLELHDLDLSFGDQGLNFKVCENDNPDCCSSLTLEAPTDCPEEEDCFGFDAFEQSFYGAAIDNEPGDVIYESENLSISIHSFIDAEGESQFGAAIVQHAINHPSFTTAIEEYMLVEVINLLFNLSNYPTPIESVSIDLYRDYGGINLSVNDGELLFFETFPEGITDLGNDIQMEVIPSLEDPNLAHVIFTGNVQHLLIGGRHLDLDNLCINPDLDCHLNNLHLSHTACNDNNQYFVQVDFDYSQVSDSFYLWVEGRDTGLFSYENLPLQLGPIQGPADEEWIFGIADMLDSTCTIGDTLSLVTCEEECYINEVSLTPTECFDDGQFKILLDFEHEFTGLYFHVIINNQFYGEFHYDELPLYLGPFTGDGSTEWNIEIFDQSEICNASASLPPVSCAQECTISNIVVEPYACEEGLFFVDLAFDAINTGESGYIVFADGQISGPHSYEEPFITLGPFEGDGSTLLDFLILDLADPTCFGYAELESPDCNEECHIFDLAVDIGQCNEDGTYRLFLNFEYEGANNDFFDVFGPNNEFIGFFELADLPILIEHFPASGNAYDWLKVCINDNPNCCAVIEFEAPNCDPNECHIFDLVVDPGQCNEDGTYRLFLNFEYEGATNELFDIFGPNGDIIGTFHLAELPILIEHFPGTGNEVDWLTVCINDNPNCCAEIEFYAPDCTPGECHIFDLVVDPGQCNDDGTYRLYLNFEYEGATNELFDVFGPNGDIIGTFHLAELPILIEHFPGTGNEVDWLTVCINDNPNCCAEIEFYAPDCTPGDCHIFDLVVDPGHCNEDGTYSIFINFEYEGATNEHFDVIGPNGDVIGFFALADLPVIIENFHPSGNEYDWIQVCINDNPNCCAVEEFLALDCGNNEECHIYDIEVDPLECDGEGTYSLVLNFQHENTPSGSFHVLDGHGNIIGTFSYDDLPVTVHHFPERPNNDYDFIKVLDVDSDCHAAWEFMGPDCGASDECHIFELHVEVGDCNEDGTYQITIDFEYEGADNEYFDVYDVNGDLIGFFPLPELPVTINHFHPIGFHHDYLKVCINDNPHCCAEIEFESPDCNPDGDCHIFDLIAEPQECDEEGHFYVDLHFHFENVGEEGYSVFGNGHDYGDFSYEDNIITLGPFDGDGTTALEFVVQDNQFPDCSDFVELEPVECPPGLVWPGDANADNIAQNFDLLNIGIAYGFEGPDRAELGNDWMGFEAENWEESFADGVNFKHADCNGDGFIDEEDREAILLNYGLTHAVPTTFDPLPATDLDPPIYVDFPEPGELEHGDAFEVPVILGTEDEPVNDIYGIAFTIEFDPAFINPENLTITYPTSWLGEEDINLITLDRKFEDEGKIEVAMTRIDQNDVSGFGPVAMLIGIIDDIAGIHDADVVIRDIYGLAYDQTPVALKAPVERIVLAPEMPQDTVGWLDLKRSLTIFPNPTNDLVTVTTKYGYDIQELSVLDPTGKELILPRENENTISLKELPGGIYILRVKVLDEVFHEKIVKTN